MGTDPADPGFQPMDYRAALERVNMDRDFLAELVSLYHSEFQKFFRKIKEALDGGDYRTVRMLAHSLKGSSNSLGFPGLGLVSGKLEKAGDCEDTNGIEKNLVLLLREYQRLKTYLSGGQAI